MTVSTSVKWAVSSMVGAPTLSGTAGSLIALLDAFLVNGFGTKAVDSAQVTGGVCRMAITGASAAKDHSVIQLTGVTGGGVALNGLQRVKTATPSYVEFACDLPDGSLTGTITFKIAPLGWEKIFSRTNVAVYRPIDLQSSRFYLRVDDTGTTQARVNIYESMTDVDTGFNPVPAASVVAGGYYWWKRSGAGAQGVEWALVGDSRGLYFAPMPWQAVGTTGSYGYVTCYAGDGKSYRSGDTFGPVLTGATDANSTGGSVHGNVFAAEAVTYRSLLRRSSGVGLSVTSERTAYGQYHSGQNGPFGPLPNVTDNGLYLCPILYSDGGTLVTNGVRGEFPGALSCLHSGVPATMGYGWGIERGQGTYAGKNLLRLHSDVQPNSNSNPGTGFIDITGPWR